MFSVIHIGRKLDIGAGQTWANVCWIFIIATVGLAIFLLTANFSRREQATGFLTAEPQISRINAPRPGRVQQVVVREGQEVKRGDILIYIAPDPSLVNGKPIAEAELEHLRLTELELQQRMQSIYAQVKIKVSELEERAAAVANQITAIRAGLDRQNQIIDVLTEQLATGQTLSRVGAVSVNEIQKRETDLRNAQVSAQTLLSSLHENEALLAQLNGEKRQAPVETELRLSDIRQSLVELRQKRIDAHGRLAFQVTAPDDGFVDAILSKAGQSIDTNSTLISLLPKSSVLVAELYVPSRAIVYMQSEQRVRIAYNAFPYARYGFAEGKIQSVSETILKPSEIDKPISLPEPSYRVTVALQNQKMKVGEKNIRLRPGLTLTADIILDRQTLAQWILRSIKELWVRV
ncbi:HlyD family secretion protein [Agrobacterium sp. 22-211-1]